MSPSTYRSAPPHPEGRAVPRSLPAAGNWLFGGAVAAGLGLGLLATVVLLLWVISPYPDGGAGQALHLAADLWLLAHGAQLLRSGALDAGTAPVSVTPLLLMALPVWLLRRATRHALTEDEAVAQDGEPEQRGDPYARGEADAGGDPGGDAGAQSPARAAAAVCAGYLLVGAAAVGYASSGPIRVHVPSAILALPLFTGLVLAVSAWSARGCRELPLPRGVRGPVTRSRVRALARAGGAGAGTGAAVVLGGGALLAAGALVMHANATRQSFVQLTGAWSGDIAVLLLTVALLPNAAVWGAAYGLGPGFTLGAGSAVGPLAATGYPRLPDFPLLAALPAEGPATPLSCSVGVLPLVAGLAVGRCVGRRSAPVVGWRGLALSRRGTTLAALLAACGCGALLALPAFLAGGALGTGELARFGPTWWLTGAAAFGWTAVVGLPAALAVRAWRLRAAAASASAASAPSAAASVPLTGPAPVTGPVPVTVPGPGADHGSGPDAWHSTAARRTRWAALKEVSGVPMPGHGPRRHR